MAAADVEKDLTRREEEAEKRETRSARAAAAEKKRNFRNILSVGVAAASLDPVYTVRWPAARSQIGRTRRR